MGEKKGWRDDENVVGATPSTVCGGRKGNRENGKKKYIKNGVDWCVGVGLQGKEKNKKIKEMGRWGAGQVWCWEREGKKMNRRRAGHTQKKWKSQIRKKRGVA